MIILSYHPLFTGDKNLICAGRAPDGEDRKAIRSADAVVLSQGCYPSLYEMAQANCEYVFPNYDAKFAYPGKTGQIRLFRDTGVSHPKTEIYSAVDALIDTQGRWVQPPPFSYPFVFKFDWGGEGETVHLIESLEALSSILHRAREFEGSGQTGFLLQEQILSANRSLRVVIIGETLISYWRVQEEGTGFHTNLAKGAVIDPDSDPDLQQMAIDATRRFCRKTSINLAGIDFLFSPDPKPAIPLFLEINYYFGRRGLGGSNAYYGVLLEEIQKWLNGLR